MYCVKVPILNQCSAWLKTGLITCFTSGWGTHSGGVKRYQQPIVQICLKEYFENLKINLFHQTRKERAF